MNVTLHGSLVNVSDVGVLIIGESGSGKSEASLKLISKGHRLVADDVVEVVKFGNSLIGSAPAGLAGILEVRGIGLVSVTKLFGDEALVDRSSVDLVVEVLRPSEIGLPQESSSMEILRINVSRFLFDASSNRDLALFIETAAKVFSRPESLVSADEITRMLDR